LKTSSHIGHITELVELIQKSSIPADRVVARFFIERRYLGARDRRVISDITYGIIRNAYRIERLLRETLGQLRIDSPPVYPKIWMVAAYAVGIMNDLPEKVVNDIGAQWNITGAGVDPLVLCRGIELQKDLKFAGDDPVERLCVRYSFPRWMVEAWIAQYGHDETEKLCDASHQQAPLTLRVNTLKTNIGECVQRLAGEGIEAARTTYSPFGLVVPKRVNFSALMSFRDGLYEIQDEGSQIVSLLASPQPSEIVVDACAGGGGKSLHLAAMMQNQGTIYALDVGEQRLKELVRRSERAGVTIIVPRLVAAEAPAADDLSMAADLVLIDAPCSGSGTIRRNPFLKWRITQDDITNYARMQRELLQRYSRCARVGGTVVYATCSLFRSENDDVLKDFLGANPDFIVQKSRPILDRWGIGDLGGDYVIRLLPSIHGTDGFFVVALNRQRL
jgi:16S rRNA (cytosine967-C5)-methyltransferase